MTRVNVVAIADDYGEPNSGSSFEFETFVPVLRHFFDEVRFLAMDRLVRRRGYFAGNRVLLEECLESAADLTFVVPFENQVEWGVLQDVRQQDNRQRGGPTLAWMCDDQWRFDEFSKHIASCFDFVASTDVNAFVKYARIPGATPVLTQWGYDEERFHPVAAEPCYDVSFVGQARPVRQHYLRALRRRGFHVHVRGRGWPLGRVTGEELSRIPALSRVSLNFADPSTRRRGVRTQLKARPFELAATRTCVLTEADPQLGPYFQPGQEVVTFRDEDELCARVGELLSDEPKRQRIAQAGHLRAAAEHTYRQRFTHLFDATGVSASWTTSQGELCVID